MFSCIGLGLLHSLGTAFRNCLPLVLMFLYSGYLNIAYTWFRVMAAGNFGGRNLSMIFLG